MSGMYDDPAHSEVDLKPYPNVTRGTKDGLGRAKDPAGFIRAGEQRAREMQVEIETIKLLRQDVIHCYRKEGVNHYANCKDQVDAYVKAISDPDLLNVKGRLAKKAAAEAEE